jgi:hypothetical protein
MKQKRQVPLREGSLEWVQVKGWGRPTQQNLRHRQRDETEKGWIPRYVLEEEFKIDCSALDSLGDLKPQGTVWFTKEQATAIHEHHLFDAEFQP